MALLPHITVTTKGHALHGLSGGSSGHERQLPKAVPCRLTQPLQAFFLLCFTSPLLHHAFWNHFPNKLLPPKPLPQFQLLGTIQPKIVPLHDLKFPSSSGPCFLFQHQPLPLLNLHGVLKMHRTSFSSLHALTLLGLYMFNLLLEHSIFYSSSDYYSTLKYLLKCHLLQEAFLSFQVHVLCPFYLLSSHPMLPKYSIYYMIL